MEAPEMGADSSAGNAGLGLCEECVGASGYESAQLLPLSRVPRLDDEAGTYGANR
jgi:hypothetical protein